MSAPGHQRTSSDVSGTSASLQLADVDQPLMHVCFGPISDIAQHSITLIGATVMQSSTAHAFRQYHQNTPTIPSTPAATKTKINAEFSIQAIAGMPSAMISPRRQICQERI